MSGRARTAIGVVLVLGAAVGACSHDTPATGGNSPGQPGTVLSGSDGGANDAGKQGDSGVGDGGHPVLDAGPLACDPTIPWVSNGRLPSLVTTTLARFGGVSGDEKSLAWTAANGDLYVADRTSTGDNFTTATKVNVGATALAVDRVAMGPTGKALIAVASDRKSFVELDRASIGGAWTLQPQDVFTSIAALLDETAGTLAEPVLGADKLTFFFVATIGNNPPTLYESRYNDVVQGWAAPAALTAADVRATGPANRKRPTGASADRRTLYFYDEGAHLERQAWRDSPDVAFSHFADLAGFDEAAPTPSCQTLYFQGNDGSAGVFTTQ